MSRLGHTRDKIYKTIARQLHGVVPCWVCGEHVTREAATLEHIQPLSQGGNSHAENLAISHEVCNGQRHALGSVPVSTASPGQVQRRVPPLPLTPYSVSKSFVNAKAKRPQHRRTASDADEAHG